MKGLDGLIADDIGLLNNRITELERLRQQDLKTIDTLAREIMLLGADLEALRTWATVFHARQVDVNRDVIRLFEQIGRKR